MSAERIRWNKTVEQQNAGGFFNVLAEMEILVTSLEKQGKFSQESLDYVRQNLQTAMVEAVSDNWGEVFVHGRKWGEVDGQRQYVDWGYPFLTGLLFSGLNAIDVPEFEQQRREVEYRQEQLMTLARMIVEDKNLPLDGMAVMVSPYPEEFSADKAQELGYRPIDKTAKIRAEVFRSGARMTVELALANSQVEIWNRVWQRHGHQDSTDSISLLGNWLWFEGEVDEWKVLANLAQEYDKELSRQDNKPYFLGRQQVRERGIGEYLEKFNEHRQAVEGTGVIVDRLVGVVQAMAESWQSKRLNAILGSRINFWLAQPESVISCQERMLIGEVRLSGVVTRQILELIMTKELVMSWSMAAAVLNPKKAAVVLGEKSVAQVADLLNELLQQSYYLNPFGLEQWDWWVSSHQQIMLQQFVACGGMVGGVSDWVGDQGFWGSSLYQMPLWRVGVVLGGSDEDNDWYTCSCGYKNKINARMGDLIGNNGRVCGGCKGVPKKC